MTSGPEGDTGRDAEEKDLRDVYRLRWGLVLASFLLVFGVGAGLVVALWNQSRSTDAKVDRAVERSTRIVAAVDSVRAPLCAILYTALSRVPATLTPEQADARAVYLHYYGPGTAELPGLHCPEPLPEVASGG